MKKIFAANALELFKQTKIVKANPKLMGNLRTGLKNHALRLLGFTEEDLSSNQKFELALSKLPIEKLQEAKIAFEQSTYEAVQKGEIKATTVRNYKSALYRFLDWLEQQIWYKSAVGMSRRKRAPILAIRDGNSRQKSRRGKSIADQSPYRLSIQEFTPDLIEQLTSMRRFWTIREEPRRKAKAWKDSNFDKKAKEHIGGCLGWLMNVVGFSLEELDLELVADPMIVQEHTNYLLNERNDSYSYVAMIVSTAVAVAKWKYQSVSKRRNWTDISDILDLREMQSDYRVKAKSEPSRQGWDEKDLTVEQCKLIVDYLDQCCSPKTSNGTKRPDSAVMKSLLRYVLVAILVFCPIRQEEIRRFDTHFILSREEGEEGAFYRVKLPFDQHKVGSVTGKSREYRLPYSLTPLLDEWNLWRDKAVTATKDDASWLAFFGHSFAEFDTLPVKIQRLEQEGELKAAAKYKQALQDLHKMFRRRKTARDQLLSHNQLFFSLDIRGNRSNPDPCYVPFGKPLSSGSVASMVTVAIFNASKKLFGKPYRTTPHCFRHIAEAFIRRHGKSCTKGFSKLIGHSEAMGDFYADQLLTDGDYAELSVDDWHLPSL